MYVRGCNGATLRCSLNITDGDTKGRGKKGRPWELLMRSECW